MIKRRGAIGSAIGRMQADGKLGRNWRQGALGDAVRAALDTTPACALRRPRRFCAWILALWRSRVTRIALSPVW